MHVAMKWCHSPCLIGLVGANSLVVKYHKGQAIGSKTDLKDGFGLVEAIMPIIKP